MTTAVLWADVADLYRDYRPRIYGYVYLKLVKPGTSNELAEDLTQEVFLKAIEAIRFGRGPSSSVSGWLFRIARNLLIDEYRRRERRGVSIDFDVLAGQAHDGPTPHEQVMSDSGCELIERCISQLSDEHEQVVMLSVEGHASVKLGSVLHIGTSAAKGRLHRGRLRLAKMLHEEGSIIRYRVHKEPLTP